MESPPYRGASAPQQAAGVGPMELPVVARPAVIAAARLTRSSSPPTIDSKIGRACGSSTGGRRRPNFLTQYAELATRKLQFTSEGLNLIVRFGLESTQGLADRIVVTFGNFPTPSRCLEMRELLGTPFWQANSELTRQLTWLSSRALSRRFN